MRITLSILFYLALAGCHSPQSPLSMALNIKPDIETVRFGDVLVTPIYVPDSVWAKGYHDGLDMGVVIASPGDMVRFIGASLPTVPEYSNDKLKIEVAQSGKGLWSYADYVGQNNLETDGEGSRIPTAFVYCKAPGECKVTLRIIKKDGTEREPYTHYWTLRIVKNSRK